MNPTSGPSSLMVGVEGLDAIIDKLRSAGRLVIGPTVADGAIVHRQIESSADLPRGWTEDQKPGSYRLQPTNDDRLFGFSSPAESWKRFVFPAKTLLIRGRRDENRITVEQPSPSPTPVAFFGIRSCDLAALATLDRVFLDPSHLDGDYAARRADVFVIAAGCSDPGTTCFCASMGTGPFPSKGYDLSIAELSGGDGIAYLVESGSERGSALLSEIEGRSVADADRAHRDASREHAVSAMGRTLDAADPPLAAKDPEDPRWGEIAERCLACGNCTMVCPTCFCNSVEDTTSLNGLETERHRVWDSCFTLDFSHMHGGSTRTSISSRYRQWLSHKLITWHDQFDQSGCVGCGRCLTWCPVGIDLTVEVAALAQSQRRQESEIA